MNGRGTIVYVHGASDRAAAVADHVALIEAQVAAQRLNLDVVPAQWGEALGARLDRIDLALPGPHPAATAPAPALGLSAVLGVGPLSELRWIASSIVPPGGSPAGLAAGLAGDLAIEQQPWSVSDADLLLAIARVSSPPAAHGAPAVQGGPATPLPADGEEPTFVSNMAERPPVGWIGSGDSIGQAAAAVAASPEYGMARAAAVPDFDLLGATARAIAATVAAATGGTAPVKVAVAQSVEMHLAQTVMVLAAATLLAGYVGINPGNGLKRWATDVLIPHRSEVMHAVLPGIADVLLYQRNGGPIRRFVADAVGRAAADARPVIAFGNSLGCEIVVNAMMEPGPRPDLVVTVGSQASALETFGAFAEPGSPPPFQPWLNVYDRRDFLGFVAAPVWPDQPGITDLAIDSGLGFPDSHGSVFLSQPAVYDAIRRLVPSVDPT